MLRLFAAPLQGHTEAVWREEHLREYGEGVEYVTPFVRVEKGAPRQRDMRDFTSPANGDSNPEPQVIFKDMDELRLLLDALVREGATRVNLNMGCPFPLQTGKGRGAGLLAAPQRLDGLAEVMEQFRQLRFSAKMRLGFDDPTQWMGVMARIGSLPLDYLAVHPRTARQQYSGPLATDQFEALLQSTSLPVIF